MSNSDNPQPQKASGVARLPVEWLWENRVPKGMLTLVAGRPGQGKSLFGAYLAAQVSKKGNVIFSNLEDPLAQVVVPRLEAAGAKMSNVHFWTPILPRDTEALAEQIKKLDAKLVVMDPIAAHLHVSIFNDQDVRTALTPLSKILGDSGCAAVAISHTVKYISSKAHPLTAIGGSGGGLTGAARAVYVWGPSPEDNNERALAPAKYNLGPTPKACAFELEPYEFEDGDDGKITMTTGRLILLSTESEVRTLDVLTRDPSSGSGTRQPEKREVTAEWLTNYLSLGKRPVNELREDAVQVGLSWATIRRAKEDVEIEVHRVGFGKGSQSFWSLPDGHPALLVDQEDGEAVTTDE